LVGGGVINNVAIASGALFSGSLAWGGATTIPNTTYVAIWLFLFEIE
jgi:hypothetical protein